MIVMLLGIFFSVNAQQPDTTQPAVLVLNDGSIIKGQRIDALQPGHIRLRMADGTEVEFPIESVAEIRKDMPPSRAPRKPFKVQNKGLYATVATGLLFGNIEQEPVSFTCGAAIGYRFLPQLYLAAGGGTDIHPNSGDKFAPIYARIGGEAMKTRVTPNYFFASGYAFPYKTPDGYFDAKGGAYFEGGLGVTFRTASRISLTLNATYRQYNAERSYRNDWWWGGGESFYTDKRTYRRFGVLLGMSF